MSSGRGDRQYCLLILQVSVQCFNGRRLRPHGFLSNLPHHLVINEPLANVPDVNVALGGLPKLSLFQLGEWLSACFHCESNQTITELASFIYQLSLAVTQVDKQFHNADQTWGCHMLLQLPQNLIANVPIAKFKDLKITVLQFPHLPFLQWMLSPLSFYFHISESDDCGWYFVHAPRGFNPDPSRRRGCRSA